MTISVATADLVEEKTDTQAILKKFEWFGM
jgi:hypothetical protein